MNPRQISINDLYRIKSSHSDSVNKLTVHVEINPEHGIFPGHFPGNPILPGAAIIQMLKEILENHYGREVTLSRALNIKYLSFINPVKHRLIIFDTDMKESDTGGIACNSTIHSDDIVFCSFKGEFSIK